MHRFAQLLDDLSLHYGRLEKLALLTDYFRRTPDPDRGWALASLTDGLPVKLPLRRLLLALMSERIDPYLYELSRDYVGDTAETVALLWPERGDATAVPQLALDAVVNQLRLAPASALQHHLAAMLDASTPVERWALLKFIGGALRVGVSARMAKTALAEIAGRDVAEIEEVWHALKPPYTDLFAWIEGKAPRPDTQGLPAFRAMMLASAIEEQDWPQVNANDFAAEWKWDGIRVQIAAVADEIRIFSRTGEDISLAFPDVASAFNGHSVTADGELLVAREGIVAPFSHLQQRLNRKTVSAKLCTDYPAHVRLYDLLFEKGEDLRALTFDQRRLRLEAWHGRTAPGRTDLSPLIPFTNVDDLRLLYATAREGQIEGMMLKRRQSPYLAGRPRGHWFKWKRAALTLDCVLMYAQRGSGKRSSFYSDFTFGVWRVADTGAAPPELVPIGKAYSGFTDQELKQLDSFIRQNTVESFGPVRSVKPQLVFEVAFDSLQVSPRHKSGLAMRFPRIHRIRWDKPASQADTLATARALLAGT